MGLLRFLLLDAFLSLVEASGIKEQGVWWLSKNKEKPGVIALPSGLQFKVLQEGTGKFSPLLTSTCLVHHEGVLIDGTVFDSSRKVDVASGKSGAPMEVSPNMMIKGWMEAMQLMVEGDIFEVYVPSHLGYGDQKDVAAIPAGSVLIFTLEMIKIKGETALKTRPSSVCDPKALTGCDERQEEYIKKQKKKDTAKLSAELRRLRGEVETKDFEGENARKYLWLVGRIKILEQMGAKDEL